MRLNIYERRSAPGMSQERVKFHRWVRKALSEFFVVVVVVFKI